MKTFLTFLALTFSTLAIAGFEGVITTEVLNNGTRISTTWFIGKDRLKLHLQYKVNEDTIFVDFLLSKGSDVMTIVTDSKVYKGYSSVEKSTISSELNFENLAFKNHENKDSNEIKYQGSNNQYHCAIWILDLDIDLFDYAPFFKADPAFHLIANHRLKGFPKNSLLTNHNGELIYSSTVTNIIHQKLSETDFEIPNGFKERELVELEYQK
ncbi:MAG: hypothetical protein HOH13_00790 [Crocinitomicaceae bacterium]|nr:hypothetical protein [Crocinitomicaceae bacterium]